MEHKRGVTCQISSYEIDEPKLDPSAGVRVWVAIATAQVYDPNVRVPPLKPGQEAQFGETARVISARAFSPSEATAMTMALRSLLYQLTAKGLSENHDVKMD